MRMHTSCDVDPIKILYTRIFNLSLNFLNEDRKWMKIKESLRKIYNEEIEKKPTK